MTFRGCLALGAVTLFTVACGQQEPSPSGPAPTVTVVGDTAFIDLPIGRTGDNGEITVTFDAVTEDSRCPSDVTCVWAGNAGIRLTLTGGDDTDVVIVNSTLVPHTASFAGYTLRFVDLTPYPASEQPTDEDDYVARIAVVDTR